jgi:hypothetical protein
MKKSIIRIIIVLLIIFGLGYGIFYLWQNSDKYFFKGTEITTKKNDFKKKQNVNDTGLKQNEEDNEREGDNLDKDDGEGDYFVPIIHKSDCDNECAGRKSVEIEYKYCREICGLNDIRDLKKVDDDNVNSDTEQSEVEKNNSEEDCDDIEGVFEEDVCWKTKAIEEKNDKYCDEIYSEELSKVCHNRVLEEIMN